MKTVKKDELEKSSLERNLKKLIGNYVVGIIFWGDSIYGCPYCYKRAAGRFHEDSSYMKGIEMSFRGDELSYFVKCPNCDKYFLSYARDTDQYEIGHSLFFLSEDAQDILNKLWWSRF